MPQPIRQRGTPIRGDVLRTLRQARQWTQEQVANRAGLSEKLIRKAERGEPIDLNSVAALASAFHSSANPIAPSDLIQPPATKTQIAAATILDTWLQQVWALGNIDAIDAIFIDRPHFYCEAGCLRTRMAIKARIAQARRSLHCVGVEIDAHAVSGEFIDCRWRLLGTSPTSENAKLQTTIVTTSLRLESGRITEARELSDARAAYRRLNSPSLEGRGQRRD